jgi:3',5'-cyclic AMP phosphodiesterase CpdA
LVSEGYVIAHISDPHFGEPGFQKEKIQTAINEINDLSPNIVVVTGDLTSDGLTSDFELAYSALSQLKPKTLTIMGNHDSRNVGYSIFEKYFGERMVTYEDDKVFLLGVDSTQPDIDEGHIGRTFQSYIHQTLVNAPKDRIKIFALHHHLVPVPMAGRERDVLVDAGDILKMLVEDGVKVILCGHRHVSWTWGIEGMLIVHSGTMGSQRTRGMPTQSYTVLRMVDDKLTVILRLIGRRDVKLRTFVLK